MLAQADRRDTGWSLTWVVGGLSLGLLVAGLASPYVGRQIDAMAAARCSRRAPSCSRRASSASPLAPNLPVFIVAWLVLGLGMGAGLYDAAFSTLGRLYGQAARASTSRR